VANTYPLARIESRRSWGPLWPSKPARSLRGETGKIADGGIRRQMWWLRILARASLVIAVSVFDRRWSPNLALIIDKVVSTFDRL
jgi:hypothetical protein